MLKFKPTPWLKGLEANPEAPLLQAAHTSIMQTMVSLEGEIADVCKNRKLSQVARAIEIDAANQTACNELERVGREELHYVEQDIRRQRSEMCATVPSDSTERRYQEIRGALRSLAVTKRKAALEEVLKAKSLTVIEAVRDGTPLLCGMDAEEYSSFLEQAHEALHGNELHNLDQAEKVLTELREQVSKAKHFIETYNIEELPLAV